MNKREKANQQAELKAKQERQKALAEANQTGGQLFTGIARVYAHNGNIVVQSSHQRNDDDKQPMFEDHVVLYPEAEKLIKKWRDKQATMFRLGIRGWDILGDIIDNFDAAMKEAEKQRYKENTPLEAMRF